MLEVSGATAQEVLADLTAVERSEVPMTLGRVLDGIGVQESLGRNLGAELLETRPKEDGTHAGRASGMSTSHGGAGPVGIEEPLPDWASIVPGAPLVNGKPAWFATVPVDGVPTPTYLHPSLNIDADLPKTADANDPRLALGQAVFFAPMR